MCCCYERCRDLGSVVALPWTCRGKEGGGEEGREGHSYLCHPSPFKFLILISSFPPSLPPPPSRTALHLAATNGHLEACRLLKHEMTRRAEGGREGGREGGQAPVGEAAPVDLAGRTPLGWRVSAAGEKKELEEVGCACCLFVPPSSLPPSFRPSLILFSLIPAAAAAAAAAGAASI